MPTSNDLVVNSFDQYLSILHSLDHDESPLFRGQTNDNSLLPKVTRANPHLDTTAIERLMLQELKRTSTPFLKKNIDNDWDWLALAQHYGMATRLLDWTSNPLIALYFSCCSEYVKGDYSFVWAFIAPKELVLHSKHDQSPFEEERTAIFKPNLIHERLVSQFGWFTLHRYSQRNGRFVPLEQNTEYSQYFIKLRIPKELRSGMIKQLNICGVNSATVYQSLDGLCEHLNWKFKIK